ncbi:MAG TPA: A/G-specific adenine glycosylase [Deltaproteobacteria bacterium]|nr:A/G-specific adenine glycosylase [Deltaproteobacteria bacterium]
MVYEADHHLEQRWVKLTTAFFKDKTFVKKIEIFRKRLINWYDQFGDKDLPWRNTVNPWAILVAAFLLRKTTTVQVVKVYGEFLKKYPTPQDLLSADEGELRKVLRPLGIEYQRAKHFKALAEHIEKNFDGEIPCVKEKLKELPGVGDYIASEVLLGACTRPEPLLDRNMIRVMRRVFGVESIKKRPHTDPEMWAFAKMLIPKGDFNKARAFNYGVLDFARKICTARNPLCRKCFVADICTEKALEAQS